MESCDDPETGSSELKKEKSCEYINYGFKHISSSIFSRRKRDRHIEKEPLARKPSARGKPPVPHGCSPEASSHPTSQAECTKERPPPAPHICNHPKLAMPLSTVLTQPSLSTDNKRDTNPVIKSEKSDSRPVKEVSKLNSLIKPRKKVEFKSVFTKFFAPDESEFFPL